MAAAVIPPGPKGHFLTGNLVEATRDPLGFCLRCAREYGDFVRLRFLYKRAYLLNHPDYIEYVKVTHHRNFIKPITIRMPLLQRLTGNGLANSEGAFWLRQRRLAEPAFHRDRIAVYGEIMVAYAERMLATWRDGEIRDVHQDMMRLAGSIGAKTLVDADVTAEAADVGDAMKVVSAEMASQVSLSWILDNYLPTPGNLRFRRAVRRLDEVVYSIIRQRRASGEDPGDLLSMLLQAQDEDGSQMTDKQLRDEVLTFFGAGYDTTAQALSWTFYLLSQHPKVDAKLVAELQAALGGRSPSVSELPRLRYTEMVVKESMRLYPPVWADGREALQECEIGGYHVPAGATVLMSMWVMQRDPRYFDNPEEFKPERWAADVHRLFLCDDGGRAGTRSDCSEVQALVIAGSSSYSSGLYHTVAWWRDKSGADKTVEALRAQGQVMVCRPELTTVQSLVPRAGLLRWWLRGAERHVFLPAAGRGVCGDEETCVAEIDLGKYLSKPLVASVLVRCQWAAEGFLFPLGGERAARGGEQNFSIVELMVGFGK